MSSSPVRQSTRFIGRHLGAVAAVTVLAALVLDLVIAPPDGIQGEPQRLMYVHVPSAWVAYGCFAVVLTASIGVLFGRGERWDAYAKASAELGVGMVALTIAEGSLWGHSAWGVWWTWDPRLVSTALLLVLYAAYLALRGVLGESPRQHRRVAIFGVVAFAQVPVVHFSVLWWRTLHQPPTLLNPSTDPPIYPTMLVALLVSLLACSLAAIYVVRRRVAQLVPPADAVAHADAETLSRFEVVVDEAVLSELEAMLRDDRLTPEPTPGRPSP